ncbi:MAG TPA: hypothetical protein VH682_01335 [Gemmataceae bacterium]|jgi:hypothetical protein
MRVVSRIAAFVLTGFLLSLPALSAEDKDKKADPKKDDANKTDVKKDETPKKGAAKKSAVKAADKDKDANTEKTVKAGVVAGKVMAVIESKKSIRIQVTFQVPKLNPGALQNIQNAQIQLAQATSPQAVINAQNAMAQAQAGLYTMQSVQKDYELQATDDVKVRMHNPPAQFDDKGRIKRYTQKELKELRGNDKQPGFPAEFSDLKQDQIVQVTLIRKKGAPRTPVRKGKDVDPDLLNDFLPQMSTIIILAEPKG